MGDNFEPLPPPDENNHRTPKGDKSGDKGKEKKEKKSRKSKSRSAESADGKSVHGHKSKSKSSKMDLSSNEQLLDMAGPSHAYSDQAERDSLDGNLPSPHFDEPKSKRSHKEKESKNDKIPIPPIPPAPPVPPAPPIPETSLPALAKTIKEKSTSDMKTMWSSGDREPFTHLWVALSSMYGKLLIVLMLAFCMTEVMDNSITPLTFQVCVAIVRHLHV